MNRPILHLKKKSTPPPTVTAVTVTGVKPAPAPSTTGKPLRDFPVTPQPAECNATKPHRATPVVPQPANTLPPEPTPVVMGGTDATNTPPLTLSTLLTRFPACFNFEHPRPLKIGIHRDLVAFGHPIKAVRTVLSRYCTRPAYRRAMVEGAVRVGLDGADAGRVTKEEVEGAKQAGNIGVSNTENRRSGLGIRNAGTRPAPAQTSNIKLTEEHVVIGKIEMVCKFSELPKAVQVQGGWRFGIEQDGVKVVVTLNAKAWKKIEQAAKDWPAWIAAVSGKIGGVLEGGRTIELAGAGVQVFEKKVKEAA